MNRFWSFPLIMGLVGVAYPLVCVAEAMGGIFYFVFSPSGQWQVTVRAMVGTMFGLTALYGLVIGMVVGLVTAARELARFGTRDRSGGRAAGRLMGNLWWLGCYALGVFLGTFGLSAALLRWGGLPVTMPRIYIVAALSYGMGLINLVAIGWAIIRTALADDVLSPRVLREKWRASARPIS